MLNATTRRTEADLFRHFQLLNTRYEENLDIKFRLTMEMITTGYAWMKTCLQRSNYASFGASLNTHPIYQTYDPTIRRGWCTQIQIIKKVYENWEKITGNLIHPHITNVDIRELSIRQLSRLVEWPDVVKYNAEHGPRVPRQQQRRLYPNNIINEIASHIDQNTTFLYDVDFDENQIKMLGKDISNALIRIAANR